MKVQASGQEKKNWKVEIKGIPEKEAILTPKTCTKETISFILEPS